jgi:orotate phosphoribosyltransferase-like protein
MPTNEELIVARQTARWLDSRAKEAKQSPSTYRLDAGFGERKWTKRLE